MHISRFLLIAAALGSVCAQGAGPQDTRALPAARLKLPGTSSLSLRTEGVDPQVTRRPVRRIEGVPAPKTQLGVLKTFDSSWGSSTDAGYYTVDAADGTMHPVHLSDGMANILAAVKKGETMYCISLSDNMEHAYFSSLSTSTWNTIGTRQEIDFVNVPSDLTVDPVSGTVYGFFYQETPYSIEYSNFASFNLTYAEASAIRTMEREVYACAANDTGLIYWLSSTQLGDVTTDGSEFHYLFGPRVYPERRNTMVYDPQTGLLYAFVTTDDMVAGVHYVHTTFYSIDPVTRAVTSIRAFDNEQGYAGLFMLPTVIADEAPGQVADVTFSFTGSNPPMGTVTMTAPTKNHIGATLTGNITLIVEVDGVEYAMFDVAPGARVTTPAYPFAEGQQTVTITAATDTERGEPLTINVFAGRDIPAAPQGVTLTVADGLPHLSWQPVSTGAIGGEIDLASLTYRVERTSDQRTVASALTDTEWTDTAFTPSGRAVSYRVYAVTADGESEGTESNRMAIGTEWEVPFAATFDTADDADMWSILNVNGGSTWEYASSPQSMQYRYDDNRLPGDDWLFSPPVRLEGGAIYGLSYDYRVMLSSYPESFSVYLGRSAEPQSMTTQLAQHRSVNNTKAQTASLTFTAPEDGLYYLGFHETSDPYKYILELDNVAMRRIDSNVPAAPTMTVTPGARGALQAEIALTAPDTDADGGHLQSIESVAVYRQGCSEAVALFTDVTPGQQLTAIDTTIPQDGSYTYIASATGEAGEGPDTRVTLWVGTDVPDAVTDLHLTDVGGIPTISWNPPVTGRNGGWFDPEQLTYTVYRYFGEMEAIATSITDTHAADNSLRVPQGEQMYVSYAVFPYAGGKAGRAIESNYILAGAPFAAPLTENFAGADMRWYPWVSVTDRPIALPWTLDAAGTNPPASDWSGDQGLATFHSAGESETGVGSWFISPKISLQSLTNPVVSFSLYHSTLPDISTPETMQLLASVEDGEYVALTDLLPRDCGQTGWRRYTADLSPLPRDRWIRLAFRGITAGGADMYIDGVTIEEARRADGAIVSINAPRRIAAGEQAPITLIVENRGTAQAQATVTLLGDEQTLLTETLTLTPGERQKLSTSASFALGEHTLSASIAVTDDENNDNDTMTCSLEGVEPLFAAPTALSGAALTDRVRLEWTSASAYGAVTDSFESYDDWAIDGIGDWTMTDRDYDNTVYINAGAVIPGAPDTYPHCTDPKAWQVINASALGINIWPEGTPADGDKMLMAAAGTSYVNADWAISPLLNGHAQTLSFLAKAFTSDGTRPERMRVLWSSTDTTPESFSPLHDAEYIEVPDSWTEYRFALPEGARYFAIVCVSDGAFALFADMVRYNDTTVPQCVLTGYEVWRDGEPIGTTSLTTYDDTTAPAGTVRYAVRALYDKGSSALTPEISITSSAVSELNADALRIAADGRDILVTGADGRDITLATPDGVVMRTIRNAQSAAMRVASPGIYIVTVGHETRKLTVR